MSLQSELPFTNLSIYSTAALKLRPQVVLQILEEASQGYLGNFIAWAREIKKRDLHYNALLNVRYNAVLGTDVTVESYSGSRQDVSIANAVREFITESESFRDLLLGLLDGIEKGFSAVEIVWELSGRLLVPRYLFRDQRYFSIYNNQIGLKRGLVSGIDSDTTHIDWLPIPDKKFAIYIPTVTDTIPLNGIAYSAMFYHVIKMFAIQNLAGYVENFGMPYRIGRYDNSASPQDIEVLKDALRTLGTQAAAVIPDSMHVELTSTTTNGAQPYMDLINLINGEMSKLILGQVRSMDETSGGIARASESGSRDFVRQDILEADLRISQVINKQVIKPFVDINFGITRYPRVVMSVHEKQDQQLLELASRFIELGLKVPQSYIRDKLHIPDPIEGEEVFNDISLSQDSINE